jgi:hypothetical protein
MKETLHKFNTTFDVSYIYHFLETKEIEHHSVVNKNFQQKLSSDSLWSFLYERDFASLAPPVFNKDTVKKFYIEKDSRWKKLRNYSTEIVKQGEHHSHHVEVKNIDKIDEICIEWKYNFDSSVLNSKKPLKEDFSSKKIEKKENLFHVKTLNSNFVLKIKKNEIQVVEGPEKFVGLLIPAEKPILPWKGTYKIHNGILDSCSFLEDAKEFFSTFVFTFAKGEIIFFYNPSQERLAQFTNGTWISNVKCGGNFPSKRNFSSMSRNGDKIYIWGGENINGTPADSNLHVLDAVKLNWSTIEAPYDIEPRKYHISAMRNEILYFLGGNYEHSKNIKNFNSVLKFNLKLGKFETTKESKGESPFGGESDILMKKSSTLKKRFANFPCILLENELIVFGLSINGMHDVFHYNFELNTWKKEIFHYLPRHSLSPKTLQWSVWDESNPDFIQISNPQCLIFKKRILVFDGVDGWFQYKMKSNLIHDFLIENPISNQSSFKIPTETSNHLVLLNDSISIINETNNVYNFE